MAREDNRVVVVLSCGTDNPNRSTRALHLASVAHKEGNDVKVFLLDEGVYIASQGLIDHVKAATGDAADDMLAYLQGHEVPILACTPCAKARKIGEDDLVEGARMGSAAELFTISKGATVISL